MGTKAQQHYNNNNSSSSNKITSPTWLLNWFSQLTKSTNNNNNQPHHHQSSSVLLPWKKDNIKSSTTTSIVITEPTTTTADDDYYTQTSTIKINNNNNVQRPSITISNSSSNNSIHIDERRRNSQQTTCSSINTTVTDSICYCRRDSSNSTTTTSSSVISDLWSKAKKKRHKHHHHQPRFHWPHHRHRQSLKDETPSSSLKPSSSTTIDYNNDSSLPSSYRQSQQSIIPKHLKRHSISSSFINNSTNDNTPSGSRPNSIIYCSQPASPNFAAYLLNNDTIESYWLNDHNENGEQEIRWEVKHELTKLAVDGLFSIPESVTQQKSIEKHILQIGCGDATWAMEVAHKYPKWIVIGLDTYYHTTTNNTRSSLLRNFRYIKCHQLLQSLKNFPDDTFDFISSRFLITSYSFDQYKEIISECIRITKQGGYIEVMEMDLRIYHQRMISSSVTHLLNNEVIKVIESKSLDPRLARRLQDLITAPELTSEIKYISLPLGVWGGKLGVMFRDDVHALIESLQQDIADGKDKKCRTEDELDYKMDIMDNEMDSNRAFMNLHVMVVYV